MCAHSRAPQVLFYAGSVRCDGEGGGFWQPVVYMLLILLVAATLIPIVVWASESLPVCWPILSRDLPSSVTSSSMFPQEDSDDEEDPALARSPSPSSLTIAMTPPPSHPLLPPTKLILEPASPSVSASHQTQQQRRQKKYWQWIMNWRREFSAFAVQPFKPQYWHWYQNIVYPYMNTRNVCVALGVPVPRQANHGMRIGACRKCVTGPNVVIGLLSGRRC